jgi:septum formation protein
VVVPASATRLLAATQVSRVRFCRLRPGRIDAYIASGEPFGKAGAYAIQGLAAGFVRSIEGSHSGIMGLPLFETSLLLRKAGYPPRPES